MTDDEFRADLLASAASRAAALSIGVREAFVAETLERLRDAGEVPDAELCSETLTGQRARRLEMDAFAFDDADDSLHLFIAVRDGSDQLPPSLTLTDAREQGFNRLLGIFDQAREGWLSVNIEESRPLWSLAGRIRNGARPSALRVHVISDRKVSERLREIPLDRTREGVPVTFQIWDMTRLKRIHEAHNVRDDLFIDLSSLPGGGLTVLPAAFEDAEYSAYLAVVPGNVLADIYIRHGSRLLEGNVRTFLGRRGNVNKGIGATLAKEPGRFFAYNNGLAATASAVQTITSAGGAVILTGVTDLQIVNGAQTTASLAALSREGKLPVGSVFVPLKLSVVSPELAEELVPRISRFANFQNSVRASDFFANHPFHQRMEQISRRLLAPAVSGSLVQTRWYYERARGQHLNDQTGLTEAQKAQFERMNPRRQVITKTDLAKVESCFNGLPDIACRGAEKAFTAFAERVSDDWKEEARRATYGEDWFRSAVARWLLFKATETLVSGAAWYENGYRAQIVAYATARLAELARVRSDGGALDYMRIWAAQAAGPVLERQLLSLAKTMVGVLRSPPVAGQNISEWAKQQACRRQALAAEVEVDPDFDSLLLGKDDVRAARLDAQGAQRMAAGLMAVTEVMSLGAAYWQELRSFARAHRLVTADDEKVVGVACLMPKKLPEDWQAARLLVVKKRCEQAGFSQGR